MFQTKGIPFSIVETSTAISKETLNFCSEASAGVIKACSEQDYTLISDKNLWDACNKLSYETSRDCQDLSSKLVAEILALL